MKTPAICVKLTCIAEVRPYYARTSQGRHLNLYSRGGACPRPRFRYRATQFIYEDAQLNLEHLSRPLSEVVPKRDYWHLPYF
jgi:hypothetical protein